MASTVLPSAKSLYLCDYHVGYDNGKVDLYGLFNAIQPVSYPHTQREFCVFAQLANGLGRIPFFVDVRYGPRDELIYTTARNTLLFPNRTSVIQVALAIQGCKFDQPGIYFIELSATIHGSAMPPFCSNLQVEKSHDSRHSFLRQ